MESYTLGIGAAVAAILAVALEAAGLDFLMESVRICGGLVAGAIAAWSYLSDHTAGLNEAFLTFLSAALVFAKGLGNQVERMAANFLDDPFNHVTDLSQGTIDSLSGAIHVIRAGALLAPGIMQARLVRALQGVTRTYGQSCLDMLDEVANGKMCDEITGFCEEATVKLKDALGALSKEPQVLVQHKAGEELHQGLRDELVHYQLHMKGLVGHIALAMPEINEGSSAAKSSVDLLDSHLSKVEAVVEPSPVAMLVLGAKMIDSAVAAIVEDVHKTKTKLQDRVELHDLELHMGTVTTSVELLKRHFAKAERRLQKFRVLARSDKAQKVIPGEQIREWCDEAGKCLVAGRLALEEREPQSPQRSPQRETSKSWPLASLADLVPSPSKQPPRRGLAQRLDSVVEELSSMEKLEERVSALASENAAEANAVVQEELESMLGSSGLGFLSSAINDLVAAKEAVSDAREAQEEMDASMQEVDEVLQKAESMEAEGHAKMQEFEMHLAKEQHLNDQEAVQDFKEFREQLKSFLLTKVLLVIMALGAFACYEFATLCSLLEDDISSVLDTVLGEEGGALEEAACARIEVPEEGDEEPEAAGAEQPKAA